MSVGRLGLQVLGVVTLACTASACASSGGGHAPSTVATVSTSSSTPGASSAQPSTSTVTTTVTGPAAAQGSGSGDESAARPCGHASDYSVSVVGDAHCEYALNLAQAVSDGYFAGDDPADPYPLRAITAMSPTKGAVTSQCRMVADGSATCTTPGGSRVLLDC